MANVQGTFYTATTQRRGVTPVSPPNAVDDPQDPLNPPGAGNTTTYKQLGDTTDKSFVGKNGYVPVVVGENQLTLQPLPNADQDGLISGGIVQWTGTDYDFNVSSALARFQGVFPLNSDTDILTLTTPDATNDRIDLFILQILFDGDGIPNGMEADFITGTPAATPIIPQINPATQIQLTPVLVTAGSTTPTLTEEVVYDENTEWTGSSAGTGTANFASATNPFQGTVSIETTNIQNGFQIELDNGVDFDLDTVQTLGMQLGLKAVMPANQNLYVTFLNSSGGAISPFILLPINKGITTYQFVGLVLSGLGLTSNLLRKLRFSFVRTSGPAVFSGFFLDIIKFEGGINPPALVNSFLNLSDAPTPRTYSGNGGKLVGVKADESGLEFVTGGGGGITGLGTTNEIAYFTGATSIASLPVATYPSLTELSYVKGATSALQTQINGKQATIAGTLTDGHVATIVAGVPTWQAPSGGGSNWTVVGSDIYRSSKVTIGQTTIITADLGVKQNTTSAAIRIDSLVKSTRRDVISLYEDATTKRYWQDNFGIPTWKLWSGSDERGALTFSTPGTGLGILVADSEVFTAANRAGIYWYPTVTGPTSAGLELIHRNTARVTIGGTGKFSFNNSGTISASTSYLFKCLSGDSIIMNAVNIAGTLAPFAVYESGYVYNNNVLTANFTGSTARQWKLGELKTVASTFDSTRHVTVEINGVIYKLALVT